MKQLQRQHPLPTHWCLQSDLSSLTSPRVGSVRLSSGPELPGLLSRLWYVSAVLGYAVLGRLLNLSGLVSTNTLLKLAMLSFRATARIQGCFP